MLFIQINTSIGCTDFFYKEREIDEINYYKKLGPIKRYSSSEVAEYVFGDGDELSSGKYDAYKLLFWRKGACCCSVENKKILYKCKSKKTVLHCLRYLENHIKKYTSEIFWYWSASRRNYDYYITFKLYSVRNQLCQLYKSYIFDWIKNNTEIIEIQNNFDEDLEDVLFEEREKIGYGFFIDQEQIFKVEKSIYKKKRMDWDIFSPEYEGSGDSAQIIITCISVASSLIPFLCGNGILEQIMLSRMQKRIAQEFDVHGFIVPDKENFKGINNKGQKAYFFNEIDNQNNVITGYVVTRKHVFGLKVENK